MVRSGQKVERRQEPLSLFPFSIGGLSLFPREFPPSPNLLSSFSWPYRYIWSHEVTAFAAEIGTARGNLGPSASGVCSWWRYFDNGNFQGGR